MENNNEVHYFYKKSYSNADTLFKYLREAGYFEDKNFLLFILEKCIENNIKIFADYIITRYMREKLTFEDFKPMIEKEDFFNTISFSSFFTYYKHLISNDFCIKFPKNLNDAFNKNSYSSEKEVNYKITAAGFEKLIDNNDIEALTIKNILAYNKYVKKELTKVSKDYSKKILVKAFNKIFNFNSFCEDIICFNGNKTKETTGLLDIIKELTFSFNITV